MKEPLNNKSVERRGYLIAESEKSFLVKIKATGVTWWLPKKCCSIVNKRTNNHTNLVTYTFNIPLWLFTKLQNENVKQEDGKQ